MDTPDTSNTLLRRVSGAMWWNSAMLPAITAVNLFASVLIRRGFGFESGIYDIALGLLNTLLTHAAIGVPMVIGQFVPAIDQTAGRAGVRAFVARVVRLRLGLLLAVLVPVNLLAAPTGAYLGLGVDGAWIVHAVSAIAALRAASDLAIKTLQALLAHLVANVVQLAQAVVLVGVVLATLAVGGSIPTMLTALAVVSIPVAIGGSWLAWRSTRTTGDAARSLAPAVSQSTVWGFALFMYTFEASNYFATPAFASVALAATASGLERVATFNVAFQIPMMTVTMLLAGFQGLYRPLFAGVMTDSSRDRLRTAFAEISKVQAVLLVPAAVGLGLLAPDYINLLFTSQFAGAAALARVFTLLLFAEALFNLGSIVLSVDRRYALTIAAQALRLVGALVFVWLAAWGHMVAAGVAFGTGRLLAALLAYAMARHLYRVGFPWAFTARVCLASAPMALVVGIGRTLMAPTWASVVLLTGVGLALTIWGARLLRVIGDREIDLLRRSGLPGHRVVVRWFGRR